MSETRAEGVRVARSLFQETGGGSTPTSALQLVIEPIDFADARRLNRLWHSRLPRFTAIAAAMMGRPCFGAVFDGLYYAVAIWSSPVARMLPQDTWLELRRLAIAPDAPKNTASRMLAVMTRMIRRGHPELVRLISYQDTEVHTGTIYKAAGWVNIGTSGGGEWSRPSRKRALVQSSAPKVRWELALVKDTA